MCTQCSPLCPEGAIPLCGLQLGLQQLQQQLRTSSNANVQTQAKSAERQVELSTTQVNKFQGIVMRVLRHANQDVEIIIGQPQGRGIILGMFGPVGQDYR